MIYTLNFKIANGHLGPNGQKLIMSKKESFQILIKLILAIMNYQD